MLDLRRHYTAAHFATFVEAVHDISIDKLDDEGLVKLYTLWQHQADRLLAEMSKRGFCCIEPDGTPSIPFPLPPGVEQVKTILNDSQEASRHAAKH